MSQNTNVNTILGASLSESRGGLCCGGAGERRPRCFYRVNQGGFIRAGKSLDNNVTVRQTGQLLLLLGHCRPSLAVSSPQEESAEEHFHLLGQDNCNCDSVRQKVQFFLQNFLLHYWAA